MKNKSIFQNILVWFGAVQLQQLIDIFPATGAAFRKKTSEQNNINTSIAILRMMNERYDDVFYHAFSAAS